MSAFLGHTVYLLVFITCRVLKIRWGCLCKFSAIPFMKRDFEKIHTNGTACIQHKLYVYYIIYVTAFDHKTQVAMFK